MGCSVLQVERGFLFVLFYFILWYRTSPSIDFLSYLSYYGNDRIPGISNAGFISMVPVQFQMHCLYLKKYKQPGKFSTL